jgi:uncharacterized membrane protein
MTQPSIRAPFCWLAEAWQDLRAYPGIALFYGLCFWAMATTLRAVFRNTPEVTMTVISGCLLVGPFLAMGLYEVSRLREQARPAGLWNSLTCWRKHLRSLALLVLVLVILELVWGRASLVVFAVFFSGGLPNSADVLQALLAPEHALFVAVYLAVGGLFATIAYMLCATSIPMILDRDTDAVTACLHSVKVVLRHPLVMALWGAMISVLILGALLAPWSIAIIAVGPWIGHASWHAYRTHRDL